MIPKKKARKITSECEWKKSLQRVLRVYKGDGIKNVEPNPPANIKGLSTVTYKSVPSMKIKCFLLIL